MSGLIPFNRRSMNLMNLGFNDLSNALDDFFTDGFLFRQGVCRDTFKIDVSENEKEYTVEAELPGINKDDIRLDLEDGQLSISINKEESNEESDKKYIHRERRYCSMRRSVLLADAANEGVNAKLNDGILNIVIPKAQKVDTSIKIDIE